MDDNTQQQVLALGRLGLSLRRIEQDTDLVAAQGLGKTMIAKNLVHQAVLAGQLGGHPKPAINRHRKTGN